LFYQFLQLLPREHLLLSEPFPAHWERQSDEEDADEEKIRNQQHKNEKKTQIQKPKSSSSNQFAT
jgi:hypothetical protein